MKTSKIALALAGIVSLGGCTGDDDSTADQPNAQLQRDGGPSVEPGAGGPEDPKSTDEDGSATQGRGPQAGEAATEDPGAMPGPGMMKRGGPGRRDAAGAGGAEGRAKRPKQPKGAGAKAEAGDKAPRPGKRDMAPPPPPQAGVMAPRPGMPSAAGDGAPVPPANDVDGGMP